MNKFSLMLILCMIAVSAVALVSPSMAKTGNPCAPCHSSKYQYLDILEGSGDSVIPTSINVGETKTITVVLQNLSNAAKYNQLKQGWINLESKSGSFIVNQTTVDIPNFPLGTLKTSWEITGVKAGQDSLVITAQFYNPHGGFLSFNDVYNPSPMIEVNPPPPATYQLIILPPEGSGSTSPGPGKYNETTGSHCKIVATPSAGWVFDHWTLDEAQSGSSQNISFAMDINHLLRATFNQTKPVSPPGNSTTETPPIQPPVTPPVIPPPVTPQTPPTPSTYNVTIVVSDPLQSTPITNATVSLGGVTKSSDNSGACLYNVEADKYSLIIAKPGYSQIVENITVSSSMTVERMLTPDTSSQRIDAPMVAVEPTSLLVSSLSLGAYLMIFAFALVTSLRRASRGALLGFIIFSLTLTSAILITRAASVANMEVLSSDLIGVSAAAVITLTFITLMSYWRNHVGVSKATALTSSVILIYLMSQSIQITAVLSVLTIPILLNDYSEFKGKAIAGRSRLRYVKANRAISWVFTLVTVFALVSGYALTKLHISSETMMPIHTGLGYAFAALLVVHVYLSVISKYPWGAIIKGVLSGKNSSWSLARFLQVVTAVALVLFGVVQTLSGLGYVNIAASNLVPIGLHLNVDGLLVAVFVMHAAIGVKAVALRYKIATPAINRLITGFAATLVLSAILLALVV